MWDSLEGEAVVIKVLGPGCMNCQKLELLARKAAEKLGIDAEIIKVTDYPEIMAYGVMSTPALVVDERLRLAGRVPSLDEVVQILQRAQ
jgi:small redox-active disulfide protein 2